MTTWILLVTVAMVSNAGHMFSVDNLPSYAECTRVNSEIFKHVSQHSGWSSDHYYKSKCIEVMK